MRTYGACNQCGCAVHECECSEPGSEDRLHPYKDETDILIREAHEERAAAGSAMCLALLVREGRASR